MNLPDKTDFRWTAVKWLIVVAVFVLLLLVSGFWKALLATVFLSLLVYGIDPRLPLAVSIVAIGFCPLMVLLDQDSTANTFALIAYYFFALGVLLIFIDHIRATREVGGDDGRSPAS